MTVFRRKAAGTVSCVDLCRDDTRTPTVSRRGCPAPGWAPCSLRTESCGRGSVREVGDDGNHQEPSMREAEPVRLEESLWLKMAGRICSESGSVAAKGAVRYRPGAGKRQSAGKSIETQQGHPKPWMQSGSGPEPCRRKARLAEGTERAARWSVGQAGVCDLSVNRKEAIRGGRCQRQRAERSAEPERRQRRSGPLLWVARERKREVHGCAGNSRRGGRRGKEKVDAQFSMAGSPDRQRRDCPAQFRGKGERSTGTL